MPTFFTFKRLSSIGAAALILIMVVMLYPALPPQPQEAHAATRLGLFVTQEELNIWKQRAAAGPYKSTSDVSANSPGDWTRILANANSFLSNPSSERWGGDTLGRCFVDSDGFSVEPNGALGHLIRDAAFAYVVTGNTSYGDAVRTELLSQAAVPGVQWAGPLWSGSGCLAGYTTTNNPSLGTMSWMSRIVLAYDMVRSTMTASQQSTMDTWLLAFANRFWDNNYKHWILQRWPNRDTDNYSSSPYGSGPHYKLYYNGPDWSDWHLAWNNSFTIAAYTHGLIGIVLNNSYYKSQTQRFFKEFIKYNVWSNGSVGDMYRWDSDGGSPCKGWWYPSGQVQDMALLAEAFARTGDTSLYAYTTTEGYAGTTDGTTVKSLNTSLQGIARRLNHTDLRYATRTASKATDSRYLIDGVCNDYVSTGEPGAFNWQSVNDVILAIGNRYYNDSNLKNAYLRSPTAGYPAAGSYPSYPTNGGNASGACSSAWEGDHCPLPGTLFMFGQMENAPSPYPGSSPSPTPTPTPTPTPSPTPAGTQLVSTATMIANSQNFAAENPLDRLWDGCTTPGSCAAGTGTASSFWVEFDFGQPYSLTNARLFGDMDGNWVSNSWALQYKQNAADPWAAAFTDQNALMNNWVSQPLSNLTARYVRVTVNGNTTTNATEARELEIYGTLPTPTPTPIACSQYTPSSSIPTGFASPYDVVSSPTTNLMNATCDTTSARLDLGRGDPLQYIYNQGYLFKTGGTNWTPISYTSTEQLIANAWYPKTAATNITLTSTELANPNYNLAYICSWTGTSWKCGCRDQACTQSYWQIQSFKR